MAQDKPEQTPNKASTFLQRLFFWRKEKPAGAVVSAETRAGTAEAPPPAAKPNWEDLPVELGEIIAEHTHPQTISSAAAVSHRFQAFFAKSVQEQKLFHAIFMGREEYAIQLVKDNPKNLLKRGTYMMPLLNADGKTFSEDSEQIYHNATPLELMLYTGDFAMWNKIFPLIIANQDKLEEKDKEYILETIKKIKRGGPDLVKVDFDPREAIQTPPYWERLKSFTAPNDADGNPCIYNLLQNPNGIICYNDGQENLYFYADSETENLRQLHPVVQPEETAAFEQLQNSITEMVNNSSRRTNDAEYNLINKVFEIERHFGKKIERNGIHYELKRNQYKDGVKYQDTFDGCNRLINAYRKYLGIIDTHVGNWTDTQLAAIDRAWINLVALAQRYSMPNIIQRYLEPDQPFYPLSRYNNNLRDRDLVRANIFYNWLTNSVDVCYPFRIGHSVSSNFGLYKGRGWPVGVAVLTLLGCVADLAAIRRIKEVPTARLNELEQELAEHLQLSSGPAARAH